MNEEERKKSRNLKNELVESRTTIIDEFINRSVNPHTRTFQFNSLIFGAKSNSNNSYERVKSISPKKQNENNLQKEKLKINNKFIRENQIPINKTINFNLNLNLKLDINLMPVNKINIKTERKGNKAINSSSFIKADCNQSIFGVNKGLKSSFASISLIDNKTFKKKNFQINKDKDIKRPNPAYKPLSKYEKHPINIKPDSTNPTNIKKFDNTHTQIKKVTDKKNKENINLHAAQLKILKSLEEKIIITKNKLLNGNTNKRQNNK